MQLVVDGLLTSYSRIGKGKAVLLLHGWGDSQQTFSRLVKDLSAKYEIITVDLPGFGASQSPDKAWQLEDFSNFLNEFVRKAKIGSLYAIVGHSNGGAIAIQALASKQLKSEKLILMASSGIRTGSSLRKIIFQIIAKTGNLATIWMPERYRLALRKSLYNTAGSDYLAVPHMEETFKNIVRRDGQKEASELNLPVLLIYADGDNDVPLSHGKIYDRIIKDSKLVIIPEAGHFVHHDQPEDVYKEIVGFLNAK